MILEKNVTFKKRNYKQTAFMLNTSMKVMQLKGISVRLLPPFLFFTTGIYTFGGHKHF